MILGLQTWLSLTCVTEIDEQGEPNHYTNTGNTAVWCAK